MSQIIRKANKDHICDLCGRYIEKGHLHFYERRFFCCEEDGEKIFAGWDIRTHFKCDYKQKRHKERFERFKPNCKHKLYHTEYSYIPGEAVMEPDYEICDICGKTL